MKVGYTEFSYGYAFTENLIRASETAPSGAPVFPNLVQEGLSGFDVKIDFPGMPLFFQYKLPELMKKGTAFEISKFGCTDLALPFFRISMMRNDVSRQHALLLDLERQYPSCVFYAAPCLRNVGEFDRAYNGAAVAQRSAFFSPGEIGPLPDNKVHTISYRPGLSYAYFCSEPRIVKAHTYERVADVIRSQFKLKRFNRVDDAAREIRDTVLELASPPIRAMQDEIEGRIRTSRSRVRDISGQPDRERVVTDILVAREIARIDLGVDVLIAQPG